MSWATAIVLIVLISAVAGVMRSRNASRPPQPLDAPGRKVTQSAREKELEREVEELRDRIQVLERIATDGREARRISDEIDRLRDE